MISALCGLAYFASAVRVLKDEGINIWASNLCSEICLPANEEESFVCNLASMNLLTADEWMETDAVETMIWFLDAVMEEYIEKTDGIKFMDSARNFAMKCWNVRLWTT